MSVIVATDRISAFDRHLGLIPFKGSILNLVSLFWINLKAIENIVKKQLMWSGVILAHIAALRPKVIYPRERLRKSVMFEVSEAFSRDKVKV